MYLETIQLKTTRVCLAEPGKIIIVGTPSRSLDQILPFLANLPGVIGYKPDTNILTFRRKTGFMTLYPEEVIFTQVTDNEEGISLFEALVDAINSTWEKREQLTAVTNSKKPNKHLDYYLLLPKTNCKICGESTCLAFASKLFLNEISLDACEPLFQEGYEDRRITLEAMLS
ncbi:MAG: hypothetical protein HON98_05725 [Chloroflexi bacterium]|jgi:ArsR family metal-binding transcriptional regulator|nr:hypothetical protein [Chloroflexota bacterium]MBT3670527.1 hypothetical protein [Chloroflexota bacterium]MBT4002507.1 hypothetical protein [Chloroflexota bacterium]MBT4304162.1 hypothetical protein [Chloroflexota bacterium]MBT4533479.1 hypothetical protein [Chloroflexota bacterium]